MTRLLCEEGERSFFLSDVFEGHMLQPVLHNMLAKAEAGWDDYDELYHCRNLMETIRKSGEMAMDYHTMALRGETVGLALVTRGRVDAALFLPPPLSVPEPPDAILMLNYFHISPHGRGRGGHWLRDVILPRYCGCGYQVLYVKSTHSRVFSLYGRLGGAVGSYKSVSDNGLYTRNGTLFRIPLG